jgi:calcineurin-like phosphoesterase family protein
MIWLTSDFHLNHSNIIEYERKHFKLHKEPEFNLRDMHSFFFDNWCRLVKPKDDVYFLGDWLLGSKDSAEHYAKQLPGHIHLIKGNHDNWAKGNIEGFASARDVYQLKYCGRKIWLSHYPHHSWPSSFHGSLHCFGHVHGNYSGYGRSMDVGVDTRAPGFADYLYSIDEVISILESKDCGDI